MKNLINTKNVENKNNDEIPKQNGLIVIYMSKCSYNSFMKCPPTIIALNLEPPIKGICKLLG